MAHHCTESFKCAKCQDAGFVYAKLPHGGVDYSQTLECECSREENRRLRQLKLIRMCELPEMTDNYTFDTFRVMPGLEEAYAAAKQLAEGDSSLKWLTLFGNVDTGKTHLAVAICRRWLLRGVPAKYAYVPRLLDELRRGYRQEGDDSYDHRFDVYTTIPLLILDDLGVEKGSEWAREKLDTIVDTRAMKGLALVVTTNLPMNELPKRIASRLQRVPFGKVIFTDVPEYRLNRASAN